MVPAPAPAHSPARMTSLAAPAPGPFTQRFSLARMFLAACLVVMGTAMAVVGHWVETRIKSAVVQNSANAAALYMESFLSPLSQDLAQGEALSGPAARALVEIFQHTLLGERVADYRIWKPGGLVVHASDPGLIGLRLPETPAMAAAWDGRITGSFEPEGNAGVAAPLLAVLSPIRELWSGEIIAVAEFDVRADALLEEMADARRTGWLVVGATFLASTLALYGIVLAGDRLIRAQAKELEDRVRQSEAMAQVNRDLRARALEASARAAAQTDRFLRRLGSDLHDGPAQYLALAALRLDAAIGARHPAEAEEIRRAIDTALAEIRTLSRGLVIPDIDKLDLDEILRRAVAGSRGIGQGMVAIDCDLGAAPRLDYSAKLCIYRFLQETLSNAARYAPDARCRVTCRRTGGSLCVQVADDGPGFVPETDVRVREDGGQGLIGLRDRAESLGGRLDIDAAPGRGAVITLHLPIEEGNER